jgi:hypothetical protein
VEEVCLPALAAISYELRRLLLLLLLLLLAAML